MNEWQKGKMAGRPIPIFSVLIVDNFTGVEKYTLGYNDVTFIEQFEKSGEYADIPYVRVWKGEQPHSEYCQHRIMGVYFQREQE